MKQRLRLLGLMLCLPVVLMAQQYHMTADSDTLAVDSVMALPWPDDLRYRLDSLMQDPMLQRSIVGIMVYDLTADSILYKVNERQTMRPASTMKLVTAITALDRLGGSFQFQTRLCYTGTVSDHVLQGDVYCVGGFDPRFGSDDLYAFVESIQQMGVDTIRGRLVADTTLKDADLLGEGWCWDDDNPKLSPLSIGRDIDFLGRFVTELQEHGVVVEAELTDGTAPADAYQLCTRFHTIDQVLQRMMKVSDNFYAESMFYQLGVAAGHRPAHAKDAAAVVRRLIQKLGLNPQHYRIADGSGLSLYNYVSPELEVRLLRYAYHDSNIYLHLLPSLPIAARDGTLKSRMGGTFAAENVHAKTGTVTGVSALAGYCTAANGHRLCFSIINQGIMSSNPGRRFQDRVCNALCEP